jgi:hypothetical protein
MKEDYTCSEHGIDFRICCEECNEKWAVFKKITDASIEDNPKEERGEL